MDQPVNFSQSVSSAFSDRSDGPPIAMTAADHAWLRMDTATNPMIINSVLIFSQPIAVDTWRQLIKERFLSFQRFRCAADRGGYWRPQVLDLEAHTPVVSGKHCHGPEDLQTLISDLINKRLPEQMPLWQMVLITDYPYRDPKQPNKVSTGSAIFFRIHHSYADGMALIKVLLGITDEGFAFKPKMQPQASANPDSPSSLTRQLLKQSMHWGQQLTSALTQKESWWQALDISQDLIQELMLLSLAPTEKNLFKQDGLCGRKQVVWSEPLHLAEVKTIAKSQRAKVNDVLLSSVAGALRRYAKDMNQLTSWSEIRTTVPVNLRDNVDHGEAEGLGNLFGLVFLSLPIGIADPIERAHLLNERMQALKNSKQAWLVYRLLQLAGSMPDMVEHELIRLFSSKASAVMTNVPGPQVRLHFGGSPLEQIMFWVPQGGSIGMGVSVFTYNNHVQFGLMTDEHTIDNPQPVIDCFNREFEDLLLETLMTARWPG